MGFQRCCCEVSRMNQEELLYRIEWAAGEKETRLDLSGKGLTFLPPEIGRLTHLARIIHEKRMQ